MSIDADSTVAVGPVSGRRRAVRLVSPRLLPYLLIAPAVIYLLGITLYPFIYAVRTSLYDVSAGMEFWVGWGNYARLLTDQTFWQSLLNTVLIAGVSLAVETTLAMGVALLVYNDRWVRGWRMLYLAPMLFMPSAVAFMWKLMFFPGTSIINDLLIHAGLVSDQLNWFGNTVLARGTMVVADVWEWTPFLFVIFLAGLQGMDEEIEEAAKLDGARWYHTFWLITLPMMRPVLAIALTLRGIDLVTMFTKVSIMTNGGPAGYTETVSYFIYRNGFKQFDQGYAAAASVIVLIFTVIAAMTIIKRFFRTATL
ncbi:MAG TPA: sugar ABC transporter permease [Gammaproteobacteria bacterium]|nr:sugar ABC transporter permease [Gammaproteobacteria bacterium]